MLVGDEPRGIRLPTESAGDDDAPALAGALDQSEERGCC